ncbi:hypothetical protein [Pseudomonas sp. CFBP 13719]|uniref:hypothetical protein n=1 Tax=Pseudomonas sp. CFBP 13719 TaxID=2775303 RepID=UPI00177F003B|nr:hypothetical protein [Pseudomonas sp. CFBP 13719]MBD8685018.1 hypothetical protein [Pseudomonas sp. CFBP 13719]
MATVADFVAMLQTTFYVGCRGRRRCRHTYIHAQRKDSRTLNGAALDGNRGQLLTSESRRGVHEVEHGGVERGGGEKKRVNPLIGAIKDRLIGGFGEKSKSQISITDSGIKTG